MIYGSNLDDCLSLLRYSLHTIINVNHVNVKYQPLFYTANINCVNALVDDCAVEAVVDELVLTAQLVEEEGRVPVRQMVAVTKISV